VNVAELPWNRQSAERAPVTVQIETRRGIIFIKCGG
jgi:hypothetical protein